MASAAGRGGGRGGRGAAEQEDDGTCGGEWLEWRRGRPPPDAFSPEAGQQESAAPAEGPAGSPDSQGPAIKQQQQEEGEEQGEGAPVSSSPGGGPLLLLIPLTLGVGHVHPLYLRQLRRTLTLPQTVGIVGGRPGSSLYFVSQGSEGGVEGRYGEYSREEKKKERIGGRSGGPRFSFAVCFVLKRDGSGSLADRWVIRTTSCSTWTLTRRSPASPSCRGRPSRPTPAPRCG